MYTGFHGLMRNCLPSSWSCNETISLVSVIHVSRYFGLGIGILKILPKLMLCHSMAIHLGLYSLSSMCSLMQVLVEQPISLCIMEKALNDL